MKKNALWLLACALPAFAVDNPCNLSGPPIYYNDFVVTPTDSCAPWPFGTGGAPAIRTTAAGTTVWWYCPAADGSWDYTIRAAAASILTPEYLKGLTADIATVTQAADPTAELNRIARARVTLPMADPSLTPVWCPWWPTIYAGIPPRAASVDGTLVPPATSLVDATGIVWTIVNGFAVRSGAATNGHATQVLLRGGAVYVKSPTGGYWWKWLGPNMWQRLTTTQP